jgi:hypothetical protein
MTVHLQRFQPDTCTCVVLESWDDSVPDDQVVHTMVSIEHRGAEHASILDDSLYGVIRAENVRKNLAIGVCLAAVPELGQDPRQVAWVYTAGRTLLLSFPGVNLSGTLKATLQATCETEFGLGLIVIS